jgi:hypothetical protein
MLAMAADVYRAQYEAAYGKTPVIGAWDTSAQWAEKWSVYSRLVFGLTEKHHTAVDGQSLKNGLGDESSCLNKEKGPDRQDSLHMKAAKGQSSNSPALSDDLGKTAFITLYGGWVGRLDSDPEYFNFVDKNGAVAALLVLGGGWCAGFRSAAGAVRDLMQNKNRHYSELLCSHSKRSQDAITMRSHR